MEFKKGNIVIRTKTAEQYQDVKNSDSVPVRLCEGYIAQVSQDTTCDSNLIKCDEHVFIKSNFRLLTLSEFCVLQGCTTSAPKVVDTDTEIGKD